MLQKQARLSHWRAAADLSRVSQTRKLVDKLEGLAQALACHRSFERKKPHLPGKCQMSQVVRHYLSNLTGHSKSLFLSHEELLPTEDTRRLSFVFVKEERLHCLDQHPYVRDSMVLRFHACQTKFCEVKASVLVSEGCAGQNGVGLAGLPARVWQISAL